MTTACSKGATGLTTDWLRAWGLGRPGMPLAPDFFAPVLVLYSREAPSMLNRRTRSTSYVVAPELWLG
jgi:hypothetical protein